MHFLNIKIKIIHNIDKKYQQNCMQKCNLKTLIKCPQAYITLASTLYKLNKNVEKQNI